MLMICWLVCGPSAKRENGSETEMPGCKIKFELSRKKKSSRKTTSTSERTINHPKLYSVVRLSFIFTDGWLSIHSAALPPSPRGPGTAALHAGQALVIASLVTFATTL